MKPILLLLYITCLAGLILITSCNTRQQRSLSLQKSTALPLPKENNMLLGVQPRVALQQPPHRYWFDSIYNAYTIDTAAANNIRQLWRTKKIDIFFGTWCGDSRREVPRMLKILDNCGIPADNIRLVLVDNRYPLYKASPTHEEQGKFIFRVPTFIISSEHKESDEYAEIGRIVEYPVATLEKDLLLILNGAAYTPNYRAGAYLRPLLQSGHLSDTSADLQDIATKIKPLAKNVAELNSLGSVLLSAQERVKAATVFRLNTLLYPQEPDPWNGLANTYFRNGEKEKAREYYNKALQIAPDNVFAGKMLDSLQVR